MSVKTNIGPKRLVVGAHYGLTEWLLQRVTAVIMAVYALLLLVVYFIFGNPSYEGWSSLFANQFMKILTLLTFFSLFYHAWVGIRDIWMDYIPATGVRLVLQTLTVLWLVGCLAYSAQILWRV
ncbi:MAG: succinate dehydrogenase, hydrophobic membrane anchor protein [Polynucleobacter sp.]|jgi:succinate dehydrogenase / fumarate reductase membrane anchor subunit|nr:succinate dehydrogenase, hydrophobic membrane anchor protein [Polynucleobacter sp.]